MAHEMSPIASRTGGTLIWRRRLSCVATVGASRTDFDGRQPRGHRGAGQAGLHPGRPSSLERLESPREGNGPTDV